MEHTVDSCRIVELRPVVGARLCIGSSTWCRHRVLWPAVEAVAQDVIVPHEAVDGKPARAHIDNAAAAARTVALRSDAARPWRNSVRARSGSPMIDGPTQKAIVGSLSQSGSLGPLST